MQELYLEDVLQATRWTPDRACDCLRGGGSKGPAWFYPLQSSKHTVHIYRHNLH